MQDSQNHRQSAPLDSLEDVMRLFWARGFFETSIEDIVQATGANRAALYARYGGKMGLFESSLELYREKITGPMLAHLAGRNASLGEIRQFFGAALDYLGQDQSRRGCLLCLTATEAALHGPEVQSHIDKFLGDLRNAFAAAAARASRRGEIRVDVDSEELADFFVGAVLGVMSFARSPAPRDQVRHYVTGLISYIDLLHARKKGKSRGNEKE